MVVRFDSDFDPVTTTIETGVISSGLGVLLGASGLATQKHAGVYNNGLSIRSSQLGQLYTTYPTSFGCYTHWGPLSCRFLGRQLEVEQNPYPDLDKFKFELVQGLPLPAAIYPIFRLLRTNAPTLMQELKLMNRKTVGHGYVVRRHRFLGTQPTLQSSILQAHCCQFIRPPASP